MSALLAMVVAAASVVANAPAPVTRWSLDASFGGTYITDRSFDLVSNVDALPSGELRVGYAPGWLHRHLELDLAAGVDGAQHSTFQTWNTSLSDWGFQLGVRYRQLLGKHFNAYGRVAGFLDVATLRLSSSDALELSQTVLSPGVQFSAGVEVTVTNWDTGRFGFTLEVGYALHATAAHFDSLSPNLPDKTPAPIAAAPVDAGAIDLSGIRWRLGAAFHF